MNIERDPQKIVKLLQKKQRASAIDLGTDGPTMKALEANGVVRADGKIKTGKRGKPPVAWVIAKDADLTNLPVLNEPKRRDGDGISQDQVDKQVDDILNHTAWGKDCTCLKVGMTTQELRALNAGCTSGRWVCGALDAVRRRLNGLGVSVGSC